MACAILELVRKVVENVQRESTAQNLGKNQKAKKKVGETAWELHPKCARVMFLSCFYRFLAQFRRKLRLPPRVHALFFVTIFAEVLTYVEC